MTADFGLGGELWPGIGQDGRKAPAQPQTPAVGSEGAGIEGLPPGAWPLDPPSHLVAAVESLLFVAREPVEPALLAQTLSVSPAQIDTALAALAAHRGGDGIRLQRGGGRVQLISAPEYGRYVERFLGAAAEQKLSTAALETLAIVAYRQPATRAVIEAIRGVNSERALTTLRVRDLVDEVGRAETVGHPVLFGTTMRFLEYFGLEHPGDLPPLPGGNVR